MIGSLAQLAEYQGLCPTEARSFVFIGFLGVFTTYATFGNETVNLFMTGRNLLLLTNVGIHFVLGLSAVWLELIAATIFWR
jgi:fluoride ion exporter CrcB/FEX